MCLLKAEKTSNSRLFDFFLLIVDKKNFQIEALWHDFVYTKVKKEYNKKEKKRNEQPKRKIF